MYGKGLLSEKGNPLPSYVILFPINSKGSFICIIPDNIAHTTAFVIPIMEHWLEWKIAHCVHHEGSIKWPIAPWEDSLQQSYIALQLDRTVDNRNSYSNFLHS